MTRGRTVPQGLCHICGETHALAAMYPWGAVRPGLSDLIAETAPGWAEGKLICRKDLSRFRRLYVERMLELDRGELSEIDREVIASLETGQILSRQPEDDLPASFGERAADAVASFGGSWTFIGLFAVVLAGWIGVNGSQILARPFDPYPFILLNLVLSCVAAMQAPVIMMSQRRQETKDRQRSQNDYQVNLKAELEIRQLHEKLDHQLAHQWQKLLALQQVQIDLLEERLRDR
ncbi:MAG: DUF1003 domain-containing protein [Paracoccaceae bacterium]